VEEEMVLVMLQGLFTGIVSVTVHPCESTKVAVMTVEDMQVASVYTTVVEAMYSFDELAYTVMLFSSNVAQEFVAVNVHT
jgi:hypothetical protein